MPNIRYGKGFTITNMQEIITKIGFRPNQSRKSKCNVLICTSVQKSIHIVKRGDITEYNIGIQLLSMDVKLRTLRGCMTKGWAKLALDIIRRRTVIKPLWRAIIPYVLLSIALSLAIIIRPLKTMKVRLVIGIVLIAIGTWALMKSSSFMTKIWIVVIRTWRLMACNISWWWLSWHGQ